MDAELAKILEGVSGLTPEQKTAAEAAFNIDALAKTVKDGFMRQSDYSRKQDELKKERERLEANWNTANEEFLAMQRELEETRASVGSTAAEKNEAARKLKEAEDKLTEAVKNQIDPSKFLSKEDFEKQQQSVLAGQTAYFGDVLEVVAEHQALFGQKLSPKQFMQDCIAAKKTPMEFWQEKYNVASKREEIAKGAEEKKQQEWETKGYQKRIAEEANPATRQPRSSENPFYVKDAPEGKQPWEESETPLAERKLLEELQAARG